MQRVCAPMRKLALVVFLASFSLGSAARALAQEPCSFEGRVAVQRIATPQGGEYTLTQTMRVVLRGQRAEVTGVAPLEFSGHAELSHVAFVLAHPRTFSRLAAVQNGISVEVHAVRGDHVTADVVGHVATIRNVRIACRDLAFEAGEREPLESTPRPSPQAAPAGRERIERNENGLGARPSGPGACGACGYFGPQVTELVFHRAPSDASPALTVSMREVLADSTFYVVQQGEIPGWLLVRGTLGSDSSEDLFGWVRAEQLRAIEGPRMGLGTAGTRQNDPIPNARRGLAMVQRGSPVFGVGDQAWARVSEPFCAEVALVQGATEARLFLPSASSDVPLRVPASALVWVAACPP